MIINSDYKENVDIKLSIHNAFTTLYKTGAISDVMISHTKMGESIGEPPVPLV